MRAIVLLAAAVAVLAGVSEPRAGVVLTADREVRELLGVRGNYILGDRITPDAALSAACFGGLIVVKKSASVLVNGREFDAPSGDALFGPAGDPRTAVVYFRSNGSFARLSGDGVENLPIDPSVPGGEVVALSGGEEITVFVSRADGLHQLRVRASDGGVRSDLALPFAANTAVALPGETLVYGELEAVVIRGPEGSELRVPMRGRVAWLAQMGDGWVQARLDSGGSVAVHAASGEAFVLPAASIEARQ